MILHVFGWSFRNTPIELRERLAFEGNRLDQALKELNARYRYEAVILNTCNRVEVYLAQNNGMAEADISELLGVVMTAQGVDAADVCPYSYQYQSGAAVTHLLRVASGLDSLVVGEAQIAAQVREAYETARTCGSTGPILNALFQHSLRVAKRVRTETGISQGKLSIASVAVDFVRQVFSHFSDKTILVIGAGKMGELTLRHLKDLGPKQIVVTNRNVEKAVALADSFGGRAAPWDQLDEALVTADIVVSTTGAPEPIVTLPRYEKILARRTTRSVVILDIAVPRDFDPRIHDGDRTCLFNIDDLSRICDQALAERHKHVKCAEAIVVEQTRAFLMDLARRRNSPVIIQLKKEFQSKRQAVLQQLFSKLNGRLTELDKEYIDGAFSLLQNQILNAPISALSEDIADGHVTSRKLTLPDALCRLFRLEKDLLSNTNDAAANRKGATYDSSLTHAEL